MLRKAIVCLAVISSLAFGEELRELELKKMKVVQLLNLL